MTRRQRIQRVITPRPLPEAFIPLMRHVYTKDLAAMAETGRLTARMDTLDILTNNHIQRLEQGIPSVLARVHEHTAMMLADNKEMRVGTETARQAVLSAGVGLDQARRSLHAVGGRTLAKRLKWLVFGQ